MAESAPAPKPRLSSEERRRRWEERLAALRLRMAIGRALDERGIAEPAATGAALGMPAEEATKLLTRHRWREGDVTLLAAAAARLGLPVGGSTGAAYGALSAPWQLRARCGRLQGDLQVGRSFAMAGRPRRDEAHSETFLSA